MIVALYGIALAMVAGGIAAVAQGVPYIMVERGWTMVIAGTVGASAGFVLLGIAVLSGRVKRMARDLAAFAERAARPDPAREAASPALPVASAGAAIGSAAATTAAPPPATEPDRRSTVRVSPPPLDSPGPTSAAGEETVTQAFEDKAAAATEPGGNAPADAGTVVGTYSSGGNTYVMYADGSISADTPNGMYRFKSLDELKEFIAAGGEAETARA